MGFGSKEDSSLNSYAARERGHIRALFEDGPTTICPELYFRGTETVACKDPHTRQVRYMVHDLDLLGQADP